MSCLTYTPKKDCFDSHEELPTDDNVITSILQNKFDRNDFTNHFLCLVDQIEYPCTIAIDGQWGSGKTFFVKQAKTILECCNPYITTRKNPKIQKQFQVCISDTYLPIYFDAWANDNTTDPLLSIIHTIATDEKVLKEDFFEKQAPFLKKLASFVDALWDKGLTDFYNHKEPSDILKAVKDSKGIEEDILSFLDECKYEKANKIVLFIDELDRCKPSFAVRLLERIKHFFSVEDLIVVLSINSAELIHTIKACYGQGFDSDRYLDRFFDYRLVLPQINTKKYLESIKFDKSLCLYSVLEAVIDHFNLSVREIERLCRAINVVSGKPANREKVARFSPWGTLFYSVFAPVILGLKITNKELFQAFIQGNDSAPLLGLWDNYDSVRKDFKKLLTPFGSEIGSRDAVEALYKNFFSQKPSILELFFELINMLSSFASYH